MKDVLIIRSKTMLKPEHLYKMRVGIEEQLKTGLVVLPAYLEAELINVPDDIQVIVESEENKL